MSLLLRTGDLPRRDRADFWCTSIAESFVPMEMALACPDRFNGSIRGGMIGQVHLHDVTADAHVARRTVKQASAADGEYYKVNMPIQGYCLVSQDGREAPLMPGDIAICDTTRPFSLAFEDTCKLAVAMFPKHSLRFPGQALSKITAQRVSGRHGIGALVAPLMKNLLEHIDEVDPAQSQRMADVVLDLLSTLFAAQLGEACVPARGPGAALLIQVKDFIESHLHDADLTPDAVAASVHISTGYLHKLFRAEGTSVSRYIRERRLENCRRDLADPFQSGVPVCSVGAHWGFLDAARFSRVFKETYGITPREYRLSRDAAGTIELTAVEVPGDLPLFG
jgi:AraC-like DNA-binding protein